MLRHKLRAIQSTSWAEIKSKQELDAEYDYEEDEEEGTDDSFLRASRYLTVDRPEATPNVVRSQVDSFSMVRGTVRGGSGSGNNQVYRPRSFTWSITRSYHGSF